MYKDHIFILYIVFALYVTSLYSTKNFSFLTFNSKIFCIFVLFGKQNLTMTELFHLSTENHNGEIFFPRVPKTAAENEDTITPRICFAPSFEKCVLAINPAGDCCAEYIYFVHAPVDANAVYIPTEAEVPDVYDTDEVWICSPVELKCIGKAVVTYSILQDVTVEFVPLSA